MQESHGWDDCTDIMHEYSIAPQYHEWYGEDFVAVQRIVLEICKQKDEQSTRRLTGRPPSLPVGPRYGFGTDCVQRPLVPRCVFWQWLMHWVKWRVADELPFVLRPVPRARTAMVKQ
jgi:hypothetical protein